MQKYKKIGKPYLRLGIFRIFVQKETLFLHKDELFSLKIEKRKEKIYEKESYFSHPFNGIACV